jgi:hypothetical protein
MALSNVTDPYESMKAEEVARQRRLQEATTERQVSAQKTADKAASDSAAAANRAASEP